MVWSHDDTEYFGDVQGVSNWVGFRHDHDDGPELILGFDILAVEFVGHFDVRAIGGRELLVFGDQGLVLFAQAVAVPLEVVELLNGVVAWP